MKKLVLAFETSCDETCAAVVTGDLRVLSNVVSSQIDIHKLYGGVVPEIASRNHAMAILGVCEEALNRAGVTLDDITHVAAVNEPGLRGAVMVGKIFGESLAAARNLPFIPINHLAGHIASVALTTPAAGAATPSKEGEYMDKFNSSKYSPSRGRGGTSKASDGVVLGGEFGNESVSFPFLSLLVSGGHTALYLVKSWQNIKLLCQTMDDAVGECFDKVAKILGLEYPGGVKIQNLGMEYLKKNKSPDLIQFISNPSKKDGFSYSGLKTAVLNYVKKLEAGEKLSQTPPSKKGGDRRQAVGDVILRICASFQHEAIMQLVDKCREYMAKYKITRASSTRLDMQSSLSSDNSYAIKNLCVCGGVSANAYLREKLPNAIFPKFEYCTDNAAMVGAAAILGIKF